MPHMATKHVFCIAFKAFLDMVQGLLQKIPADLHFLLFTTTLQRGGTCAAHGIGSYSHKELLVTVWNPNPAKTIVCV